MMLAWWHTCPSHLQHTWPDLSLIHMAAVLDSLTSPPHLTSSPTPSHLPLTSLLKHPLNPLPLQGLIASMMAQCAAEGSMSREMVYKLAGLAERHAPNPQW